MFKRRNVRGAAAPLFCVAACVLLWKVKRWQDAPRDVERPSPAAYRAMLGRDRLESAGRADADRAAKDDRVAAEVDGRLAKLLDPPHRARWTWLENVNDLHVRPDGTVLFSVPGVGVTEADYRHGIERVAAGRSRVYGGRLRLVDSRGRLWGTTWVSATPVMAGYDGHAWIECRPPGLQRFLSTAYEDRAGNVWFAGFRPKVGLESHELTVDGRWVDARVSAVAQAPGTRVGTGFAFTEMPAGEVMLIPSRGAAEGDEPPGTAWGMFRLAGGAWSAAEPPLCRDHPTTAIFPLPDGGVASVCSAGRLRVRPEMTDQRLPDLLDRLQDDDAAIRETATAELRHLGPAWLNRACRAAASDRSPEVQARLGKVAAGAKSGAPTPGPAPVPGDEVTELYYDRYTAGRAKVISLRPGRPVALCVEDLNDLRTSHRYAHALVRMTPGEWSIAPLPDDWDDGVVADDENAYEDPGGRLWLKSGVRIDRGGRVSRPFPPGFTFDRLIGQDGQGRVYLEAAPFDLMAFDESVPAGRRNSVDADVGYAGDLVRAADGSIWTWPASAPTTLCRFSGGAWTAVPGAPRAAGSMLVPLSGGGMFVVLARADDRVAVFDGASWTTARTFAEAITATCSAGCCRGTSTARGGSPPHRTPRGTSGRRRATSSNITSAAYTMTWRRRCGRTVSTKAIAATRSCSAMPAASGSGEVRTR